MTLTGHDGSAAYAGQHVPQDVAATLRAEQAACREAIAAFISQPSMPAYEHVVLTGGHYLAFERQVLVPAVLHAAVAPEIAGSFRTGHDELARSFNAVLWATPGSARLAESAMQLRHALLQQVSICEDALIPALIKQQ